MHRIIADTYHRPNMPKYGRANLMQFSTELNNSTCTIVFIRSDLLM